MPLYISLGYIGGECTEPIKVLLERLKNGLNYAVMQIPYSWNPKPGDVLKITVEPMNWISVNDRLPERDGEYLACMPKNALRHNRRVCLYYFFRGSWLSIEGSSWPDMPLPTHWQPKPEPPNT